MNLDKFSTINQFYSARRAQLLLSGKAQRPTSSGYWAASDPKQLFELFQQLQLEKYRNFLDLGSGDGIVVAVASLFTKASGIEIDEKLHKEALSIQKRLGLNYPLKCADYLEEDLSKYDFIFINPDNYFYRLEKNLVEGFKGTLVITGNMFRPLTLKAKSKLSVSGVDFSVYSLS
jgi:protein-L-isoaspartate O-methyltransferase